MNTSTLQYMRAIRRRRAPAMLALFMVDRDIATTVAAMVAVERAEERSVIRIAHLFAPRQDASAAIAAAERARDRRERIDLPCDCEWSEHA